MNVTTIDELHDWLDKRERAGTPQRRGSITFRIMLLLARERRETVDKTIDYMVSQAKAHADTFTPSMAKMNALNEIMKRPTT